MSDLLTADMAKVVPELLVSDFAGSLHFYTKVLGFRILYGRLEDGFAYLDRDGAQLMIEQREQGGERDWAVAPLTHPFGRGLNLQIIVDDVDQLQRACTAAQADIFWPMEEKWYRRESHLIGVRQFIVQDPDGYLLRLSQPIGSRPLTGEAG